MLSRLRGVVARRPARRDLLLVPAPVPLERPGAVRVPRAAGGRPGGLRRALLRHAASGSRRSTPGATTFNGIGAMLYFLWNQPPSDRSTGPTRSTRSPPPRPRATSTTSSRSASACALTEGYGLTETGVATVMDPTAPPRLGSCGVANPGYEVTIVEPGTDLPLPPETPGEIVVDHEDPQHRHARLLRHAREDGRGLPQPQAAHRRPGPHGRRRLRLLHGPGQGLHPAPGRERLLDGGREDRQRPPGGRRERGRSA